MVKGFFILVMGETHTAIIFSLASMCALTIWNVNGINAAIRDAQPEKLQIPIPTANAVLLIPSGETT